MRDPLFWVLSVLLFLTTAKTHGRHLRLERELHGIATVDFRGGNPPFVDDLWRAERVRYAIATPILVIGVLALLWKLGMLRSVGTFAMAAVFWAPSVSFLVCSFLSGVRLLRTYSGPPSEGMLTGAARTAWQASALSGTLLFWGLSLGLLFGIVALLFGSYGARYR